MGLVLTNSQTVEELALVSLLTTFSPCHKSCVIRDLVVC